MYCSPFTQLACPIDHTPLQRLQRQWQCQKGHSFDIARQGHVNLLPVQFKRAKDPGDSKAMVAARQRFHQGNFYAPIVAALDNIFRSFETLNCLDAGCGEGYYLRALAQRHPHKLSLVGVDISKWAVRAAAQQSKHTTWVVGTNARLPLQRHSVDVVLCCFGFPVYEEFHRVLKPGGYLIMVDPTAAHLQELKALLYPNIRPPRAQQLTTAFFTLESEQVVTEAFHLSEPELIHALLQMTPHAFRAPLEHREAVLALDHLSTQLAVKVRILRPTA